MRSLDFCMPRVRVAGDHRVMDILAVVLGLVMFAVLYALIFGIERV